MISNSRIPINALAFGSGINQESRVAMQLNSRREGIKKFGIGDVIWPLQIPAFTFIYFSNNSQKLSRTIDSILSITGLSRLLIRCISTETTIGNLCAG